MLTYRKARRKLGSRRTRRAGTNGKAFGATSKGRSVKRRYPKPVKNIGKQVAALVRASLMAPATPPVTL